ncbi:hypothetical protein PHYSODRAFT_412865, partial [Phytophthora sojae]
SARSRRSCLRSDLKTARKVLSTIKAANHPIGVELQHAIVTEALKKKIRHRERCRVTQARQRERQLELEADIQHAIERLWKEIEDLEAKCNDPSRLPASPTPWGVVGDYFRHFNYFLARPGTGYDAASEFLRGIMAPDVVDGSVCGVDARSENWRRFALYFGNAHIELRGMKMPSQHTLVADITTTVTVTWNTLQFAFPHLNSDAKGGTQGGAWSPIASRIIGRQLLAHGSMHFGWDDTSDKVVRFQMRMDLLTPMLNLLGNLEDVLLVFSKASITPDDTFV